MTDPYLDPPTTDLSVYSERSLPLPDSFWCYDPWASTPEVSELPALREGRVTFGCLNNFIKVNADVIAAWSRVMRAVDRSRMILLAPVGDPRQHALKEFAKHGIDAHRIELVDRQSRADYLATYRRIDLCLDTFPCSGHTTSFDSSWTGVPVVTLRGATVIGRAGVSVLMNLGLPELIASNEDDYLRIATGLCGDLPRLSELRAGLRARLEASPLMDGRRFARSMETLYRQVWREWCGGGGDAVSRPREPPAHV